MAETEITETADYDKSAIPTAHASTHESGGPDAIDNLGPITGLIISGDGVITWQGASSALSYLFETKVSGDTNPRFRIRADGRIEFGVGSAATDAYFYRDAAVTLESNSRIQLIEADIRVVGITSSAFLAYSQVTGDTFYRFGIYSNGSFLWGPGTATRDCQLVRRAANILNTPDRFEVGTLGVANSAAGTTPGNCQNKAEIFDAAGNSLGFIAIYDAIT